MSSKEEPAEKIVTGDLGKAIKPVRMTPLNEEYRGLKTVPMTPVQPAQPTQSAPQPTQPPQSGKK